jgi:hypothetical protein
LAFALADVQNAILSTTTTTTCVPPTPVQFVAFHPGPDEILSPGEITGGVLFFLRIVPDLPVAYTPHLFSGIPPR